MKTVKEVSDSLCDKLVKSGKHSITIPHDGLYDIAEREKIKTGFLTEVSKEMKNRGYIFASGDKIHLISQDTDYSPVSK